MVVGAPPPAPAPAPRYEVAPAPDGDPVVPIVWSSSEPEARARAVAEERALCVFVFAEWSAAAQTVDRTVFVDRDVQRAASAFVMLRLDVSAAEGDAQLYAERYGVRQLPAIVLFDSSLTVRERLEGLVDAQEVSAAMLRAATW